LDRTLDFNLRFHDIRRSNRTLRRNALARHQTEVFMAQNRSTFRNIVTRSLAAVVMLGMYGFSILGASTVLLGATSTAALARGGGGGGRGGGGGFGGGRGGGAAFHGGGAAFHGGGGFRGAGGFRGGGFRGRGFRGRGFGFGLGYPYYYDDCYLVRRRVLTRYGWRIRRVEVCN
jgi:hypothetical protein